MRPVYLDYAATSPCDSRVVKAMLPYFTEEYGNPACKHTHGRTADAAVEDARIKVAALIRCRPKEIVFTSGATESDNLALKGAAHPLIDNGRPHIVTVATEHKAVLNTCRCLEGEGVPVTYLPVDRNGLIDLDMLWDAITPTTGLVSVMSANNETGVIQDLPAIGAMCREAGIAFHVDAAQSYGKVPIDIGTMNIDLLSMSGHKIYGPKGVGALYIRGGEHSGIEPQIEGGGQECNLRSGTLNVPAIVGLGTAAAIAGKQMDQDAKHTYRLRDLLSQRIAQTTSGVYETAQGAPKLPGTLHLTFAGAKASDILRGLDGKVSVTSGSACASGCNKPSHVMKAMSHPAPGSTIRFTIGRPTTSKSVERAAQHIANVVNGLR